MSNPDSQEETPETYSGPWLRRQLLQHANYVASNDFPALWKWGSISGTLSKLMVDHSDGGSEDVYCRVVGVVSDDRLYLDMHGNYNPKYAATSPMHKSRLQFTLRNPNDVDFSGDYKLAYKRLEAVQDKVATGRNRSWFLMNDTMRLSFPLWDVKDEGNDGPEETELTENYVMRSDLTDIKIQTQESYQIRIMRVSRWGSKELLEPTKFATVLPGALVDVTFVLHHNFIASKTPGVEGVNSYTAFVQEVEILKGAPPAVRSPFLDRRKGGALSVSQSPRKSPSKALTSRGEQVAAAEAFLPQPSAKALEKRKKPEGEVVASSSKRTKEVPPST